MLDLGVIELSVSPYSSPVVLVPKKDGLVWFCINFQKLNKVIKFDAEPMPTMEEVINKLSGHKKFIKINLSKGHWQVELTDESKPLTAFETPWRMFQNYAVQACKCWCFIFRRILIILGSPEC